ncbi:LuxR C-terminal-related transcriptional regulator [Amycolatopsis keratiniphila]|uniref:helix-turn-helix transcriptional regulator n=1 Tax=Amycolatopsis keratiniphila TaxID=129921 RepID=UPI0033D619F4
MRTLFPDSHEGCQVTAALALLMQGNDRLATAAQAELVLADEVCQRNAGCLWHGVMILLRTGEFESVDAHLWKLERRRDDGLADLVALMRAEHAQYVGDLMGAREAMERLVTAAASPAVRELVIPCYLEVLVAANEPDLGDQVLRDHDFGRLMERQALRPFVLAVRGYLHLAAGRANEALRDALECSRLPVTEVAAHFTVAHRRGLLALAAAAAGRPDIAGPAAAREYEAATAWRSHSHIAWALYVLELVEGEGGPSDRLRDAIDLMEIGRSPVGLAALCFEQGRRFLESGQEQAGRALLLRADEAARRIGDKALSGRIENLLGELTSPAPRTSLTAQELKIAELAQNGYSNKQIAERLVLTVRTIEFHLSNVYRKLGISGRRALANEVLPPPQA